MRLAKVGAVIAASTLTFATPASAHMTQDQCYTLSNLLKVVAEQRDGGMMPSQAVKEITNALLLSDKGWKRADAEETAKLMVKGVYEDDADQTPEEIQVGMMRSCSNDNEQ